MKQKITNRNIKFFLLGAFTLFVVDVAVNWKENVASFKDGYRKGMQDTQEHWKD